MISDGSKKPEAELAALLLGLRHRGLAIGVDDATRVALLFRHAKDWSHQRRIRALRALLARTDEECRVIEQLGPLLFISAEKKAGKRSSRTSIRRRDLCSEPSAGESVPEPSDAKQRIVTPSPSPSAEKKAWKKHFRWVIPIGLAAVISILFILMPLHRSDQPSVKHDSSSPTETSQPPTDSVSRPEPAGSPRPIGDRDVPGPVEDPAEPIAVDQDEPIEANRDELIVKEPPRPPLWLFWLVLAGCSAVVTALIGRCYRYLQQKRNLQEVAISTGPRTYRLDLPDDRRGQPQDTNTVREAAFHLSAPTAEVPAPWLNSVDTVETTTRNAGRLTLCFDTWREHRPVLFIEDVSPSMARWPDFFEQIVNAIDRHGGEIHRYYMIGTPEILFRDHSLRKGIALEQVLADLPEAVIVIGSDAAALATPTATAHSYWLGLVNHATWLHPQDPELWGPGARWLAKHILVIPLTEAGLLRLGTIRRYDGVGWRRRWRAAETVGQTVEAKLAALRRSLGESAFWWLAAGAVLDRARSLTTRLWWALASEQVVPPGKDLDRVWEINGLQVAASGRVGLPIDLREALIRILAEERPEVLAAVVRWTEKLILADLKHLDPKCLAAKEARALLARLLLVDRQRRSEAHRHLRSLSKDGFGELAEVSATQEEESGRPKVRLSRIRQPGPWAVVTWTGSIFGILAAIAFLFIQGLAPMLFPAEPDLGPSAVGQVYLSEERQRAEEVLASRREGLGSEHPDTLRAVANLAAILHAQADYAAARELEEGVLAVRRRVLGAEHSETLTAMNNLAQTLKAQGDLSRARELEEEVLAARRRVLGAEHPDTLTTMGNLAATLRAQGDYAGARELEEEVLATRRRLLGDEHLETLTVMNNLAQTLKAQGDLSSALELEEEVLAARRRVLGEAHPDTLATEGNLAATLRAQGDLSTARQLEEGVLALRRRLLGLEHPDTLTAMGNLAATLRAQGDYARARELEEEVLDARRRVLGGAHPDTLAAMNNLAQNLKAQGDLAAALELTESVLAARRQVLGAEHPDTLTTVGNLAATLRAQGDLSTARQLEEEVLVLRPPLLGLEHPDTLTAMGNLAATLRAQGDYAGAREMFAEVLATRRRVLGVNHPDTLTAIDNLAGTLYLQEDLVGARRLYEEILNIRRSIFGTDHKPDTVEEFLQLYHLGLVYRDGSELQKAADLFLPTLDALEAQTGRAADSDDGRSRFKARYDYIYRTALMTLLDLRRTSDAFQVLERFRAQSFLRMISRRDFLLGDLPPDLVESRRNLATRYDRTTRELDRLMAIGDADGIAAVRREQRDLHRERERIQAEIRRISPRLAEIEDPRPLTADEIRRTLDPGTLVLSYSVAADRAYLFVLSRYGKIESYQLAIRFEALRGQILRFSNQVRGPARENLGTGRSAMGRWLYERLIEPAAERIAQSERLLIFPDGPLHFLPFAALGRTNAEGDEQYLIEWKPVHTALSATVYAELRKLRTRTQVAEGQSRLELVAFGDPSYLEQNGAELESGKSARFTPLPQTAREVEEIARLYPAGLVRKYLGRAATEESFKAVSKNVRIVHFAGSSAVDPVTPLDSWLGFSGPEKLGQVGDNGVLQAWEIIDTIRLGADLVVLSGSETAFGPERGGEGLISLSRAFLYAGARTVAGSLWNVNDQSTAELMIRFHRHLRAGKAKDQALRAAQMEFIRAPIEVINEGGEIEQKDYSAPYHWAAFQLIGDWQ